MEVIEKDGWVISIEKGALAIAADKVNSKESVELDPSGLKVQHGSTEVYIPMWLLATLMDQYTKM